MGDAVGVLSGMCEAFGESGAKDGAVGIEVRAEVACVVDDGYGGVDGCPEDAFEVGASVGA